MSYEHKYHPNKQQYKEDIWTGTSYQVKLDYRNDFLSTSTLNLFKPDEQEQQDD